MHLLNIARNRECVIVRVREEYNRSFCPRGDNRVQMLCRQAGCSVLATCFGLGSESFIWRPGHSNSISSFCPRPSIGLLDGTTKESKCCRIIKFWLGWPEILLLCTSISQLTSAEVSERTEGRSAHFAYSVQVLNLISLLALSSSSSPFLPL